MTSSKHLGTLNSRNNRNPEPGLSESRRIHLFEILLWTNSWGTTMDHTRESTELFDQWECVHTPPSPVDHTTIDLPSGTLSTHHFHSNCYGQTTPTPNQAAFLLGLACYTNHLARALAQSHSGNWSCPSQKVSPHTGRRKPSPIRREPCLQMHNDLSNANTDLR